MGFHPQRLDQLQDPLLVLECTTVTGMEKCCYTNIDQNRWETGTEVKQEQEAGRSKLPPPGASSLLWCPPGQSYSR